VPLGFSAENVSVMILEKRDPESSETPIRPALKLAGALRGVSGIEAAAVADFAAFGGASMSYPVRLPGEPAEGAQRSQVLLVGPDYFAALRTRLLLGRGFTERDRETGPRVAVLGESLAHWLFSGGNAIGQRVRLTDQYEAEVVGVAEDIKYGTVKEAPPNLIYLSVFHSPGGASAGVATIQIRSRFPAGDVAELVRERIRAQGLAISLYAYSALADDIGASYRQDRIRMLATGAFSLLALFLITAGIYGLMAYSVARRTREIGVRMAIGSTSASILCLVLQESSRLIMLGIIAGVPGALAVMKAISGVVFGLSPIDGISLTIAVLLVSVTGVVASIGPARRAARLDPVNALRME
jgi:ABC-type antimicrobial peptide transport system permease subunit